MLDGHVIESIVVERALDDIDGASPASRSVYDLDERELAVRLVRRGVLQWAHCCVGAMLD